MTGPEAAEQGQPQAPALAAATRPAGRRRWAVPALAAAAVLGLGAGVLSWAPWSPAPVLRPAGLAVRAASANSITFRWSRPAAGPLPDRYLIVANGTVTGSVPGTVTSYRQAGLDPDTISYFRVIAVRDGKRSPRSARLAVKTLAPPLSQARLQGSWTVIVTYTDAPPGSDGSAYWQFSPVCAAGACNVKLSQTVNGHSYQVRLTRVGRVYQGRAAAAPVPCSPVLAPGPGAGSVSDPGTATIRLRITAAAGRHQAWIATSFSGTIVVAYKRISFGANSFCSGVPSKARVQSVS